MFSFFFVLFSVLVEECKFTDEGPSKPREIAIFVS